MPLFESRLRSARTLRACLLLYYATPRGSVERGKALKKLEEVIRSRIPKANERQCRDLLRSVPFESTELRDAVLRRMFGLAKTFGAVQQIVILMPHDEAFRSEVRNALHEVATTPEEKILASRLGSPSSKPPA